MAATNGVLRPRSRSAGPAVNRRAPTRSSHRRSRASVAMTPQHVLPDRRTLLNKVPEVTVYFWVIKVLCTTVGETAADFLNIDLGLGLTGVSVATGVVLAVVMVFQFRAHRYVPGIY